MIVSGPSSNYVGDILKYFDGDVDTQNVNNSNETKTLLMTEVVLEILALPRQ